jgi:glycosyltransferase involved in cell wall biosynthesis
VPDVGLIHAICLVKDEQDIVGQTLASAMTWCDRIYVIDNGSKDGTWELIEGLSREFPGTIQVDRDARPFSRALRGAVYRRHRTESVFGDWWCILDADELYIDEPRGFLGGVPARYDSVWSASFQFYFTDEDLRRYEEQPSRYGDDVPIESKIRYYVNNWSELRFFRQTDRVRWNDGDLSPTGIGRTFPGRIRLKHFQYRSPGQIQKRTAARFAARGGFAHERRPGWQDAALLPPDRRSGDELEAPPDWRSRIMPTEGLDLDVGDGRYVIRPDLMPPMPRGGCFGALPDAVRRRFPRRRRRRVSSTDPP